MKSLVTAVVVGSALLVPAFASADETQSSTCKPITIVGRPSRPFVVIEIKRETPNVGLRPLAPPKSFMGNQ